MLPPAKKIVLVSDAFMVKFTSRTEGHRKGTESGRRGDYLVILYRIHIHTVYICCSSRNGMETAA